MPFMQDSEIQVESGNGGGSGVDFLKLQPGDNRLRIVSPHTYVYKKHTYQSEGKFTSVTCPGGACQLCNQGLKASQRFVWLVIDRTDSAFKILEVGVTVFVSLQDYAKDADYGDYRQYDVNIKKTGSGQDTKYTVIPARQSTKLSPNEEEQYKELAETEAAFDKIFTKRMAPQIETGATAKPGNEEVRLEDLPF